MTDRTGFEHELDGWFAAGPKVVAGRVIDAALAEIDTTPQRPTWLGRPWRTLPMHRTAYAAAAVIAILAVGGLALLVNKPAAGPVVGAPSADAPAASAALLPSTALPSPTPSPTLPPSPTVAPTPLGILAPGTHSSQLFRRRVTYTVPAGWSNEADSATYFDLSGSGESIEIVQDTLVPRLDDRGCVVGLDFGAHRTSDLLTYWASHPGLAIRSREPITIGGLHGWLVSLAQKPSLSSPCGGEPISYAVNYFNGSPSTHRIGTGETMIILDDPGGQTILISGDLTSGETKTPNQAMTIVRSFDFDLTP